MPQPGDTPPPPPLSVERLVGKVLTATQAHFQQGEAALLRDPVVLDLDNDGVELTSRTDSKVYFNIAGTQFANITGWATGGDGILVRDTNGNGNIDSISELVGGTNPQGAFAELKTATYDSNQDGLLNSSDSAFSQMRVWTDADEDGHVDSGELQTLSSLNITSLNLDATDVNYEINGNLITQESTFTQNGQARQMLDVWLAFDTVNTVYTDPYDLDARVLFLPEQRGYGEIPNLSIAMSLDEGLLDMVAEVAAEDKAGLFDAGFGLQTKMRDILMKWAGVDAVTPTALGSGLDAQQLAFIEKVMGRSYAGTSAGYGQLVQAWKLLSGTFSANILAQAGLREDLGSPVYDPVSDSHATAGGEKNFVLHYGLEAGTAFNDVYVVKPGSGSYSISGTGNDTVIFTGIDPGDVRMWTDYSGTYRLHIKYSSTEEIIVYALLQSSGLSHENRVERVVFDNGTVWDLTQGLPMTDTDDAHTLLGTANNDILDGRGGNDTLYGHDGNDTLAGGTGTDTLWGGLGDDIYVFSTGDGIDSIIESVSAGTDTVSLKGVNADDIRLWTEYSNGYMVRIQYTGSDYAYFYNDISSAGTNAHQKIERVVFDDGTIWNMAQSFRMEDNDTAHSLYGTAGSDSMNARGGNDSLYAYDGNDTLIGGMGADTLQGGLGNDTYIFSAGDGVDALTEAVGAGTDILVLHGVNPDDVRVWTDYSGGYRTRIQYTVTDEVFFYSDLLSTGLNAHQKLEQVIFDNGTIWDLSQGLLMSDTNDGNTLQGTAGNDIINARGGNDNLWGYNGNDVLNGGIGTDTLQGGIGDDTYVFNAGDGSDTLTEAVGGGTDTLVLHGINPDDVRMWTEYSGGPGVRVQYTATDQLFFYADTLSTGTNANARVERISFDNGTLWDLTQGLRMTDADAAHDLYGTTANDIIDGRGGNDTLRGFDGNDNLTGGTGDDSLIGGNGNDTYVFSAGSGSDIIHEYTGGGTDILRLQGVLPSSVYFWVEYYYGGMQVTVKHGASDAAVFYTAPNASNGASGALFVEQVVFDNGTIWDLTAGLNIVNDNTSRSLQGTNYNDTIKNGNGGGYLYGYDGNDTLEGGYGTDNLLGGSGNDVYILSGGTDNIYEYSGGGIDTVQSNVSYTLGSELENLTLTGTSTINGTGNALDNILVGNSAANTLTGGAGNDSYTVDNSGDIVVESASQGDDTVNASITYTLPSNVEYLWLTGTGAINGTGNTLNNALNGNSAANTLTGGGGNDTLNGHGGADAMIGGTGDDSYTVDDAGDVVTEGVNEGWDAVNASIAYALSANVEALWLTGSAAINGAGNALNNAIGGNSGNNTLNGGAGNDTLYGDGGEDTLYGDAAHDAYTQISFEHFEGGASGWNDNTTESGGTAFTTFLGRQGGSAGAQDLSKTYTLSGTQDKAVIAFDLYEIDSWDAEAMNFFVNDTQVLSHTYWVGGTQTFSEGSSGNVSWRVENIGNAGQLGFGSGQWWQEDQVYRYTFEIKTTGTNVKFGFGSALNGTISDESYGVDNVRVSEVVTGEGNDTLYGGNGGDTLYGGGGNDTLRGEGGADTLHGDTNVEVAFENFESGASGWSDNTTESGGTTFTTFLGRQNGSGGAQDLSKTYDLSGAQDKVKLSFDLYEIDSWDTENLQIFINDTQVISHTFWVGGTQTFPDGSLGTVSWHVENIAGGGQLGFGSGQWWQEDQAYRYTLEIDTDGSDIKIGFGSSLDGTITDEAYGIDNIRVTEIHQGNDLLSGGADADTLYGGAGADIFEFAAATAYGAVDTIGDFKAAEGDVIDISDLLAAYDPLTEALADFVQIQDSSSNSNLSVDRDGTGSTYGWTHIATLQGVTGITDEAALVANGNLIVSA